MRCAGIPLLARLAFARDTNFGTAVRTDASFACQEGFDVQLLVTVMAAELDTHNTIHSRRNRVSLTDGASRSCPVNGSASDRGNKDHTSIASLKPTSTCLQDGMLPESPKLNYTDNFSDVKFPSHAGACHEQAAWGTGKDLWTRSPALTWPPPRWQQPPPCGSSQRGRNAPRSAAILVSPDREDYTNVPPVGRLRRRIPRPLFDECKAVL